MVEKKSKKINVPLVWAHDNTCRTASPSELHHMDIESVRHVVSDVVYILVGTLRMVGCRAGLVRSPPESPVGFPRFLLRSCLASSTVFVRRRCVLRRVAGRFQWWRSRVELSSWLSPSFNQLDFGSSCVHLFLRCVI